MGSPKEFDREHRSEGDADDGFLCRYTRVRGQGSNNGALRSTRVVTVHLILTARSPSRASGICAFPLAGYITRPSRTCTPRFLPPSSGREEHRKNPTEYITSAFRSQLPPTPGYCIEGASSRAVDTSETEHMNWETSSRLISPTRGCLQ